MIGMDQGKQRMIRTASMRNRRLRAPCALIFMLCAGVAQAAGQVTNGNDSGPGSLRDVASSGGLVTFQLGIASITLTSGPIAVPEDSPMARSVSPGPCPCAIGARPCRFGSAKFVCPLPP